ncbi:hypothetical protein CPAV1605_507 [seawater metagenome]|uniref:YubB ferredoxin-like domain-containing protein n=1 Tax=seawater metagenome TaxID=1561972 RepID=A0A5E8CLN2_9ZZZZ
MPNDCFNNLTIVSHDNPKQLQNLFDNEFTDKKIRIDFKGNQGILLEVWTPWQPDFKWLESLLEKYPNCWIKNEWWEEGGRAGIWTGGSVINGEFEKIKKLEWNDICIEGKHQYFNDHNSEILSNT